METVTCPVCGHEQEFDTDNDTVLCDECNTMLEVYEEKRGKWVAEEL